MISVLALLSALVAAGNSFAQELKLPAEHHPWGRFPVGSWKLVRVTSESLDEQGKIVSTTITETKTTLIQATAEIYTLRSDVTVTVDGKAFVRPPQTKKLGFSGEVVGQTLAIKKTGEGEVSVNGRKIPCELRQVEINGDGTKRSHLVYYSPEIAPHVLRKESTFAGEAAETESSAITEAVALGMPYRVLGELRPATYQRTIHTQPQETSVTVEILCDEIPGGVVAHSSRDLSAAGKTIRRSTLELVDYAVASEKDADTWGGRRRIFHRNRRGRTEELTPKSTRR